MHLRFGLYCELQAPPAKSHTELYTEFLEQVEHADRLGLEV